MLLIQYLFIKKILTFKSTPASTTTSTVTDASSLDQKIVEQGNKVRDLKAQKVSKADLDPEIKTLLDLKNQYKQATGCDWKQSPAPVANASAANTSTANISNVNISSVGASADQLNLEIIAQGDKVRDLKARKVAKTEIDCAVKFLLNLKAKYKEVDWI